MVQSDSEQADRSNLGTAEGQYAEQVEEAVAPWQQQEQEQEQEKEQEQEEKQEQEQAGDEVQVGETEKEKQENGEEEQQSQQIDDLQHDEQTEDINMDESDPLAGLGSVDDIAAAAMQAANLSAFFGDIGKEGEEADHGTKRSHDEMTREEEEASVMEQFSTVAPNPADTTTQVDGDQTLPAVASFQNSFAQFQAGEPATATSSSAPALHSTALLATAPAPTDVAATEDTNPATVTSNAEENTAINLNEPDAEMAIATEEGGVPGLPLIGFQDLQAVAQAAMGLDANGNPLPGNEESHRALAEAVKRLSAAQGITLPNPNSSNHNDDSREDSRGSQDGGPVKRFQCTQCERAFARAYNLNTHLATHDPDPARSKPFPCPYPSCKTDGGRSFSRKHDLQRHVASTHENEPEPGINGVGEEGSRQTGGLASLGLGTPGRKFRCEDCGRAFVRRDALKRHQCTKIMEPSNEQSRRLEAPDYYSNAAAGLSLYTSNAAPPSKPATSQQQQQQQQQRVPMSSGSASTAGSNSYDSDPFGPNGITYENLSKEVQDMAMQLVAQAQSYNEHKGKAGPTQNEEKKVAAPESTVEHPIQPTSNPPPPPPPQQTTPLVPPPPTLQPTQQATQQTQQPQPVQQAPQQPPQQPQTAPPSTLPPSIQSIQQTSQAPLSKTEDKVEGTRADVKVKTEDTSENGEAARDVAMTASESTTASAAPAASATTADVTTSIPTPIASSVKVEEDATSSSSSSSPAFPTPSTSTATPSLVSAQ